MKDCSLFGLTLALTLIAACKSSSGDESDTATGRAPKARGDNRAADAGTRSADAGLPEDPRDAALDSGALADPSGPEKPSQADASLAAPGVTPDPTAGDPTDPTVPRASLDPNNPTSDPAPVDSANPAEPAFPIASVPVNPSPSVCPPACGPTTDQFYDNNRIATIRVTIDEADLDGYFSDEWLDALFAVKDQCNPVYLRSSFVYEAADGIGDVALSEVGIRARGSRPLSTNKLKGFKLNFHKPFYEELNPGSERRRFADINRLNTLSLEPAHGSPTIEWDHTHLFQCLTYKMMRDFGVPAPRCNHLQVYVNGGYVGLMENVEEADHGKFLEHRFGSKSGMMVKASPSQGDCGFRDSVADLAFEGDSFSDYASPLRYDIEWGSEADAEAKLIPMFKCADITQTPNDDDYRVCIGDWIDVNEWLHLIAAESVLPELESLMYDRNINLYFVPEDAAPHGGRWQAAVWDVDSSFNGQTCKIGGTRLGGFGGGAISPAGGLDGGVPDSLVNGTACDPFTSVAQIFSGSRIPFITRLTSVFKAEYCEALDDFLDQIYLPSQIDEMAMTMEPAMTMDPADSQQNWLAAIAETRDYIASNGQAMRELLPSVCD
jgi:hypothetical protein